MPMDEPYHYVQTPGASNGTPYGRTPGGIDTPAAAETPWGAETPWLGAPDEEPRWFEKQWSREEEPKRRRHPYEAKSSAVQSTAQPRIAATDVAFWPWVGPRKPTRPCAGIDWEEYERMVVITFPTCIVVGRVSDSKPWEPLWSFAFPDDMIFQATWSYDMYTRHPLVLCAGRQGILYMLDGLTHECLRVFRGHGDDILSIAVCKSHPYIVATTSTDKSIRIWNLLGAPPPDIPQSERSENYPMGDADEGTECFAILAGEGMGHRAKVISCAFHPRHAALATGGADQSVKIWALPTFPLPDERFVTPRGYRPQVIYFPVFSSSRVNDSLVDWVEWLGHDTIVARETGSLVCFHWLGYKRFFHPRRFYALSTNVQYHDMHESHSWHDMVRYPVPNGSISMRWYIKPAIHHAFRPTPEEEDEFEENRNLVHGCLLAMPVESKLPEIHIFNPLLYKDDPPPEPYRALRPLGSEDEWDPLPEDIVSDDWEPESEPEQTFADVPTPVDMTRTIPNSNPGSPDREVLSTVDRVKLHPRASATKPAEKATRRKEKNAARETAQLERYKNKSMMPWIVNAKDWPSVRKMSPAFKYVHVEKSVIQAVAISPRGGKWMIGVGDIGSVFVFRQKEKIQE